jgi:hypothetical protein
MCLSCGPPARVPSCITKDPAREHDENLGRRPEVHIPPGRVEGACERFRDLRRGIVTDLKLDDAPGIRLVGRRAAGLEPVNLTDREVRSRKCVPTRRLSIISAPLNMS